MTEVRAIEKLGSLGIATTPLAAFGQQGCNPARLRSFLLTQDLGDIITLEDVCADWKNTSPDPELKSSLIISIAKLAGRMHGAGLCHRDFYLCHLVVKKAEWSAGGTNLILIDLHRMLAGQPAAGRAAMKDIAGLYFSAMDAGFNEQDWALFRRHYLPHSDVFWEQVVERANKLYKKFHSKKFQQRLANERASVESGR